jgi:hypothetical protein
MHYFRRPIVHLILWACTFAFVTRAWSLPAIKEITVKELMPLASWQKQFKITEGKDRGRLVPLQFRQDPTNNKRWNLVFGDYAGISMISDPNGGFVMERLELFKSHSYILYEPALPILPHDLASNTSLRRDANFKMYDSETGRLKRAGRVAHLVKQVSHSRFDTPAGAIDGYYIEIEHHMDMPYAQLDMSIGLGCRLDDGPVYGSGQYTLKKLGIFSETKTTSAGLAPRTN